MRRLSTLGVIPLLALLAECTNDSTSPSGTTDFDVAGAWYWEEEAADLSVGVSCGDSGTVTVSQSGTDFTGKGEIAGSCTGPTGTVPFADSIHIASGSLSGTSVKFSADGCPYHGTTHGDAPDSATGTIDCSGTSGGVTIHLTGTWRLLRTPPDVQAPIPSGTVSGSSAPVSYPDIIRVGDALQVDVHATDNRRLAWVGLVLDGSASVRDSIAVSGVNSSHIFPQGVTPSMAGTLTISAFAWDSAGHLTEMPIGTYSVVDVPSVPADSVSLPGEVVDLAYDAKRGRIYLSIFLTNEVAVVDATTGVRAPSLMLPGTATGMDLTLGGDSLLVGLGDHSAFAVVNLVSGAIDTVHLGFDQSIPRGVGALRVASNNLVLATGTVRGYGGFGGQLATYNLTTHLGTIRADLGFSGGIDFMTALGRLGDRSLVALFEIGGLPMSGIVYDAASDSFGPRINNLYGIAPDAQGSAAGNRFLAGHGVYDQALALVTSFPFTIGLYLEATAISAGGDNVFLEATLEGLPGYQLQSVAGHVILDQRYVPGWTANQVPDHRFLALPDGHTLVVYEGSRSAMLQTTRLHLVHLP